MKSAEKGGLSVDPHGYDADKKINGKKRHIAVDTQGLLLLSIVHGADMQDRDGGVLLMSLMFGLFPFLLKLYADSGYQGPLFRDGIKRVCDQINVEIVKRCDVGKSSCCPGVGSSSGPSRGSTGAAGWPRTGSVLTVTGWLFCAGRPSD